MPCKKKGRIKRKHKLENLTLNTKQCSAGRKSSEIKHIFIYSLQLIWFDFFQYLSLSTRLKRSIINPIGDFPEFLKKCDTLPRWDKTRTIIFHGKVRWQKKLPLGIINWNLWLFHVLTLDIFFRDNQGKFLFPSSGWTAGFTVNMEIF